MRRSANYVCGVHIGLSDPRHRDWLLAGLLVVLSDLQIWLAGGAGHHAWRGALFATAVSASVAFRRRYPATAGVVAQGLMWLEFSLWHDLTAGAWTVAWFCALYGLAVWASPRRFAAGAALVVATDLGGVPFPGQGSGLNVAVPFAAGTLAVMLIIRRIVRHRDRRAELAERERDVAAREAVVEERARIARELHDAIAHNVSMMVVQAGAERRVLGQANGIFGLGGIVGPVHPLQVVIIKRLDPDAQAVDAGGPPGLYFFRVCHIVRIGFQGDLRMCLEGKELADPVEDEIQLRRIQQGGGAAAEIDRPYGRTAEIIGAPLHFFQ